MVATANRGGGATEHGNSAVLVTVALSGKLPARRQIELTDPGMPTHPHHHEGSWAVGRYLNTPGARRLPLAEAVAPMERVCACAARRAAESLKLLAGAIPLPIVAIALRACPPLPPTIERRIADNRAGPAWEIYGDWTDDPAQLRTDVQYLLGSALHVTVSFPRQRRSPCNRDTGF